MTTHRQFCGFPEDACICCDAYPQEKTMNYEDADEPKCDVLGQPWKPDPKSPREAADLPNAADPVDEPVRYADPNFRVKGQAEPPRYAVPILRHFKHDHLPPRLAIVSAMFADVAEKLVANVQNGPERQVALRKLLEAKDAAVRAVMEEGS